MEGEKKPLHFLIGERVLLSVRKLTNGGSNQEKEILPVLLALLKGGDIPQEEAHQLAERLSLVPRALRDVNMYLTSEYALQVTLDLKAR